MKNISILLVLIVLFTSCGEEFLTINSETELTTGNFFQTEEDIEKAVNGIYAPLRTVYNTAYMMGEMASDNTHYSHNPDFRATENEEALALHTPTNANTIMTAKFNSNYLIIARANQVLASLDQIELDESFENQKRGEALFLRALAYFDLVQYFGEVPLHLTPSTTFEETRLPLSEVPVIYNQIIEDVSEAAILLPLKSEQETGRATSGAAYTLLGNVYVVLEEWSNAENALRNVVNSGEYMLLNDYATVFNPANKNSLESVFEVQYLEGTQGFSSNWYDMLPIPLSPEQVQELTGVSNPGAISNGEQFNTPTPDLLGAYDPADLRLDASVDYAENLRGDVFPYVTKFIHPHSIFLNSNDNWPVYRYSEVLLLLAEAIFEQNGSTGEALGFVNQVRARAGLADLPSLTKELIMAERRFELAFENKRYLDLKRTNTLVTTMTEFGTRAKNNPEDYYYPAGINVPASAFTTIVTDYPIPAAESALNPFID